MVMGKPEARRARRASEAAERSSEVAGKASGAAEELQRELGGTHRAERAMAWNGYASKGPEGPRGTWEGL